MLVRRQPNSRSLRLLIAGFLMGCVSAPPRTATAPVPAPELARRLVLALDGIDYRTMVAAQARGLFAGFRPPSRLISTFPSISDIAWHEIFGLQSPPGYQRVYYSNAQNRVFGGPLDAIRPIEYENRMDIAFGAKFHHLGAYLISNTIARREVSSVVREFFSISGRSTVYAYNVGSDALQHTRGDLVGYMRHLDTELNTLASEYLRQTGRQLEIVLLSDHGHNGAVDARFLPVEKLLEARGFHKSERLRVATDVAFSVDGVTTGFGVYALPDSLATLSALLGAMDGVDLVSRRISDTVFEVTGGAARARIERRTGPTGDRFRYVPMDGDPLHYAGLLDSLRGSRDFDREGFADAPTWMRHTATAEYPAAVVRIVRGHTSVTLNPAPILVSLRDPYRVGLGMMSIADRVTPLGGTHGALGASNSLGILMTNFVETHDDFTVTVNTQLDGFRDLGPVRYKDSGARLTNASMRARNVREPLYDRPFAGAGGASLHAVEVWITDAQRAWAAGNGFFLVELRQRGGHVGSTSVVGTSYLPLTLPGAPDSTGEGWIAAPDRRHYLLPLASILKRQLEPNVEYEFRIVLDRVSTGTSGARVQSKAIATLVLRSTERAELWPY